MPSATYNMNILFYKMSILFSLLAFMKLGIIYIHNLICIGIVKAKTKRPT